MVRAIFTLLSDPCSLLAGQMAMSRKWWAAGDGAADLSTNDAGHHQVLPCTTDRIENSG